MKTYGCFALAVVLTIPIADSAAQEMTRTDVHGEPLPARALARLSASRLQNAGRPGALAFSADSKWLAALYGGVHIWNTEGGRTLLILEKNPGLVNALAFVAQPGKQPDLLISAGTNRSIRFWDLKNGGKECDKHIEVAEALDWLAVTPDGKLFAGASRAEPQIRLWRTADGKEIRRWPAHVGGVTGLAFLPDGKSLVSSGIARQPGVADDGYGIAVWDVDTGKAQRTLAGHTAVRAIALAANGRMLASSGSDDINGRAILLWDPVAGGKPRALEGFGDTKSLALNNDGSRLVTTGYAGITVWDTGTGKRLRELPHVGSNRFDALVLAPDGKTLASTDDAGRITLWDLGENKPKLQNQGHDEAISQVVVSPDGKSIVTVGDDALYFWDRATSRPSRWLPPLRGQSVFTPDGRFLACAGGTIFFRDSATGEIDQRKKLKSFAYAHSLSFSNDGKWMASASSNAPPALWNIDLGEIVRTFTVGDGRVRERVGGVALAPHGRRLACASTAGVFCWQAQTGERIFQHKTRAAAVAFSPGGLLLLAVGDDVNLLDEAGNVLAELKSRGRRDSNVTPAAFSPDGRILAFVHEKQVRLWDIAARKELPDFKGHDSLVTGLAFVPDGKALVSVSWDRTALIWDMDGVLPSIKRGSAKTDWEELAHSDRLRAYGAYCRLRQLRDEALEVMIQEFRSPHAEPAELATLITQLDRGNFQVRDQATKKLTKLGPAAAAALNEARKKNLSLETNRRLDLLLADIAASGNVHRMTIGISLLEEFDNADARALLRKLSEGAPELRVTVEARAALEGLLRRKMHAK